MNTKGQSLSNFQQTAMQVAMGRKDWNVHEYMRILGSKIVSLEMSDNVSIAYFRLWALLPKGKTTAHRIQATINGVYDYYMLH